MNRLSSLLGIKYPIIQAGMVWCSAWELASAVSNSGGLGVIGAGSMHPENLKHHIQKCKSATSHPFGVNVPLLYPQIDELMEIIIAEKVSVVITSAGNPNLWTSKLKAHGIKVIHVVSSAKFAVKAEQAGCDAVVAEGFEAGGHNGREETTTLCLIPLVCQNVKIPVVAAGGIGSGQAMLAMQALGASGVQIGSRFVASVESSCSEEFKKAVIEAKEGDTALTLKEITPVRLLKNPFYNKLQEAYATNADIATLQAILGKGRAKKGMFEGDLENGELEIGQVSASISSILPAKEIIAEIVREYELARKAIQDSATFS